MSAVKTIKPLQTTLNNVRAAGHKREPLDLTSQLTSPETWETRANERPVFWSHDPSRPMRGQPETGETRATQIVTQLSGSRS